MCRTKPPPEPTKNPYDQYVEHAIDSQGEKYTHRVMHSQGNITPLDESHDLPHHEHSPGQVEKSKSGKSGGEAEIDTGADMQSQWQWSIADEMSPVASDPRASQILDEVGKMEVWRASVADRVKTVKEKLDDIEEEGEDVLYLKDSK
jgi:hypothetical protein